MSNQTLGYWATRFMLAAGFIATAAVVLVAQKLTEPCFGCDDPFVLGLNSKVVEAAVAIGLALFGFVWMLRIFRGPREEPSAWRYRR